MEIFIFDDCKNDRNDLIRILQSLSQKNNIPMHIKVQKDLSS